MNLPKVVSDLIKAQDNFDSVAYANCFTETAIVFDEEKTYSGTTEIQQWIQKANEEFDTAMKPIEYSEIEETLKSEITGNFKGSPVVLIYHFELKDGMIHSLKITG